MKKIKRFLIFFAIFYSCTETTETKFDAGNLIDIQGAWTGYILQNGVEKETFLVGFDLDADSNLVLANTIELTPRSRCWKNDYHVELNGDKIRWENHSGVIDFVKQEIRVKTTGNENPIQWLYKRTLDKDNLIKVLIPSTGPVYQYKIPDKLNDGWESRSLIKAGLDTAILSSLVRRINSGLYGDLHSILIAKDGQLVLEEYYFSNGRQAGDELKDFFRHKPHSIASTTKAILSVIVGTLIDGKQIESVNAKVADLFPEYKKYFTAEKENITIADLLTMRSGLRWDQNTHPLWDPRNDSRQLYLVNDIADFILNRELVSPPGKIYNYSNGISALLGIICARVTGVNTAEVFWQNLFSKLDINSYKWDFYPDGSLMTDGGLAITARDLLKVGHLFLNRGTWNGEQIISEEWIRESTRKRVSFLRHWGYGYHWMKETIIHNDKKHHCYFHPGFGGQMLAVFPGSGLVVVFTAGNYEGDAKTESFKIIVNYIIPALLN